MTLKTYVFELWRSLDGIPMEFYDTLPCNPDECVFAYTINGYREFTGQTCFESEEPQPYDNRLEYASGVTDWRAATTPSEGGVIPHSIFRMYKVTGIDADDENNSYASFKLFDYTYPLPSTCYLSYWIYVKESPGGLGHITMDGTLQSGHTLATLRDWTKWGVIIDTSGQVIHPSAHTVPEGQWVRCIFSLNPAAGYVLRSLSVIYDDGNPAENGNFTAYIDDVQITSEFPAKNILYAETFANGTDENFRLGLAYTDYEGQPCNGGARIIVDGQGGGGEDWINPAPSLRQDLDPTIALGQNDCLAWRQYDHAYALKLSLSVEDGNHLVRPLIYSKNSDDSWPKEGWVNMGDPEPHYDVWEIFCRNITSDFLAEYGSVPAPLKVLNMRIAHFCNEGGNADSGGVVAGLGITGWKQVADVPVMPSGRAIKDGGCLAYDAGTGAIYASKGYKTGDFYKYEVPARTWTTLASVPWGSEHKQVYKGSVICADGNGKIYLVKGNNTNGFWEYDAATNAWTQEADVPYGESGKRVKQGAGIAWAGGAAYLPPRLAGT